MRLRGIPEWRKTLEFLSASSKKLAYNNQDTAFAILTLEADFWILEKAIVDNSYTQYGANRREEEDIRTATTIHDINTSLPVKIKDKVNV